MQTTDVGSEGPPIMNRIISRLGTSTGDRARRRDKPMAQADDRLDRLQRLVLGRTLLASRIREYLEFDSYLFKTIVGCLGTIIGLSCYGLGLRRKGLAVLAKIHRSAYSPWASRVIERFLRESGDTEGGVSNQRLLSVYERHIADTSPTPATGKLFQEPQRLLGSRILVLKSPSQDEKGVIIIDYSFVFPLFEKLFDIDRVMRRYHLVLEPSWSGYCTLDLLAYSRFRSPVFVQATEPRDTDFLGSIGSSLVPVPIAANWWIDHRIVRPIPGIEKDSDVIMVCGWDNFKRHARFFSALRKLRAMGRKLKVILVGYPMGGTREDITQRAKYFGVYDQLEIYEWISPEAVNYHLNRSKVNVLWSRREGFNRAVIEGMLAGVPCILREGHNYGHRYPYINPRTGCYSAEGELPEKLLRMVENYRDFSPREWVVENMSAPRAAAILNESIKKVALDSGERWTTDLVVKTAGLHGLKYWDEEDRQRFGPDYEFLKSVIRTNGGV